MPITEIPVLFNKVVNIAELKCALGLKVTKVGAIVGLIEDIDVLIGIAEGAIDGTNDGCLDKQYIGTVVETTEGTIVGLTVEQIARLSDGITVG